MHIPEKAKKSAIENLCKRTDVRIKEINTHDGDKTLMSIISGGEYDLKGFGVTEKNAANTVPLSKNGTLPELMIFQGFGEEELKQFLNSYKQEGIERITLKAVVTPYNITWTVNDLVDHLKAESLSDR